ncbi:hypothetical protein CSUB01_05954 [Colletotrichum sublineola]|uniref:Uncharacterized protein n=1 Tax=Colletotrichum sublineola TaxID=1173701 RepID=A0A066WVT3_COLSU|nr:hypothetical protein CSUB01_05954 [Colletotrichum sublineola]
MSLILYRILRMALKHTNGTEINTNNKGEDILYITNDCILGGTGRIPQYLMQPQMKTVLSELCRISTYPGCGYCWKRRSRDWKLMVVFGTPWQPFAQLSWSFSPTGQRHIASACFEKDPGEVVVRMAPSGRIVGKAIQVLCVDHGSPILCSIYVDITEHDSIVIFLPKNQTLPPMISEDLSRLDFYQDTLAIQNNTSRDAIGCGLRQTDFVGVIDLPPSAAPVEGLPANPPPHQPMHLPPAPSGPSNPTSSYNSPSVVPPPPLLPACVQLRSPVGNALQSEQQQPARQYAVKADYSRSPGDDQHWTDRTYNGQRSHQQHGLN